MISPNSSICKYFLVFKKIKFILPIFYFLMFTFFINCSGGVEEFVAPEPASPISFVPMYMSSEPQIEGPFAAKSLSARGGLSLDKKKI